MESAQKIDSWTERIEMKQAEFEVSKFEDGYVYTCAYDGETLTEFFDKPLIQRRSDKSLSSAG